MAAAAPIGDYDPDDPDDACIAALRATGRRLPLLVLHGLQCDISFAVALAAHLPRDQPVYAFRAVGLNGHRPPLTRIEDMAARYLAEAAPVVAGTPFVLAGFCAGGAVAKEMAGQAAAAGGEVARLFVIDTANISMLPMYQTITREQIRIADERPWRRPDLAGYDGAPATVRAFVRAISDYAGQPGQPTPYAGPAEVIATRDTVPLMTSPQTGWRQAFAADTPLSIAGTNREELVGPALPLVARRLLAATGRRGLARG